MYTHVQIIKIISNTPPDFECPKDITVTSNNCINAEVLAPPLNISQSSCGGYFSVSNNSKYAIQKAVIFLVPILLVQQRLPIQFNMDVV